MNKKLKDFILHPIDTMKIFFSKVSLVKLISIIIGIVIISSSFIYLFNFNEKRSELDIANLKNTNSPFVNDEYKVDTPFGLKNRKDIEAIFVTNDNKVYLTPGLNGKVEILDSDFKLTEGD